ncbi:MAG: hypothetical protein RJQ09_04790 [Cyclobacteriaceae bacterium]
MSSLTIVAGPSCVGKTTLINYLVNSRAPSLAQYLNFTKTHEPVVIGLSDLKEIEARIDNLIIHYDLFFHSVESVQILRSPQLAGYGNITFITLHIPKNLLLLRSVKRLLWKFIRLLNPQESHAMIFKGIALGIKKTLYYCSSKKIDQLYTKWDNFKDLHFNGFQDLEARFNELDHEKGLFSENHWTFVKR